MKSNRPTQKSLYPFAFFLSLINDPSSSVLPLSINERAGA